VMATRSGSVDPGMLLWLLEHEQLSATELAEALEHDAGLKGLGGTPDMREVLSRADAGDEPARLARDVYVHRLRAEIAAMAASMAGIDVLAFTGGVGERSAPVRALAVEGLRFLGVELDAARNGTATLDCDLSAVGSNVRTVAIEAREDLEIARQVRTLLSR
jgi:acetate kinase